ncbi:MAG: hypothetical protein ACJ0BN_00345 [Limisphaerales bacterium]
MYPPKAATGLVPGIVFTMNAPNVADSAPPEKTGPSEGHQEPGCKLSDQEGKITHSNH